MTVPAKLSQRTLVFVYGTLKRGEPNHHVIDPAIHCSQENGQSRFVGRGFTEEKFPLIIGTRFNIPFLLDKAGLGHKVRGELYEVDDKVLKQLDILENYPVFYDREVQPINCSDKEQIIPCWIYLIRKFPEHLLSDRKLLEEYKNTEELPYCERSDRVSDVLAKDDLGYPH